MEGFSRALQCLSSSKSPRRRPGSIAAPAKFEAEYSAGILTDQPLSIGQEATLSASNYPGDAAYDEFASTQNRCEGTRGGQW